MIESIFPKSLVLKEWYLHRWHAFVVLLLILPSVVSLPWSRPMYSLSPLAPPPRPASLAWHLDQFFNGGAHSGTTGAWAALVVMAFAVLLMQSERRSHAIWFSLTTPVSGRQILRVKWLFGAFTVLATYVCLGGYLMVLDHFAASDISVWTILSWSVTQSIAQIGLFSLAFLMSTMIGNPVIGFGLAYIVARLPSMFAWVMPNAYYELVWHILFPYGWLYDKFEQMLTPWNGIGSGRMYGPMDFIWLLWFVLFSLSCYVLSQAMFQRIKAERLIETFAFSKMRTWGLSCFALLGGLAVVDSLFHGVPKPLKFTVLLVFALAVWIWFTARTRTAKE